MPEIQPDRMASPSTAPLIAPHSTNSTLITTDQPATDQPEETTLPDQRQPLFTRRSLLLGSSLAGLAAFAHTLDSENATTANAQSATDHAPHMRSTTERAMGVGAMPALPPLGIIALNRMGFGPRPEDLAAFNALGATPEACLTAYIEQQLYPEAIDDSACEAIISSYGFTTLGKSQTQLWAEHVKKPGIPYGERIQPVEETRKVAFLRALHSRRQLNEVLADHWHNHFSIFGWDSWTAPMFVHYDRDVIRANMLGNFRTMLEAVATSPAMLYYHNITKHFI